MSLETMPSLVVALLAEVLDTSQLCSLRLTCTWFHLASLSVFKRRYVRTQTVEWTTNSLHRLLKLAMLPIGGAIEDIVVDATPRLSIERTYPCDDPYQLECKYLAMKSYWKGTQHDFHILTAAFKRIRIVNSITFAYDCSGCPFPITWQNAQFLHESSEEMSRPFIATMAAVARARLYVYEINTDSDRRYGAVRSEALGMIPSPLMTTFAGAFQRIRVLQLKLRDLRSPCVGWVQSGTPFWVQFLSKFTDLYTLDLSFESRIHENPFQDMARHCKYPLLKNCRLDSFQVHHFQHFFAFLAHTKGSLKTLSLDTVLNNDSDMNWAAVFRQIATQLSLNRLELQDLYMWYSDERMNFGEIGGEISTGVVLEGSYIADELKRRAKCYSRANVAIGRRWSSVVWSYAFDEVGEISRQSI